MLLSQNSNQRGEFTQKQFEGMFVYRLLFYSLYFHIVSIKQHSPGGQFMVTCSSLYPNCDLLTPVCVRCSVQVKGTWWRARVEAFRLGPVSLTTTPTWQRRVSFFIRSKAREDDMEVLERHFSKLFVVKQSFSRSKTKITVRRK